MWGVIARFIQWLTPSLIAAISKMLGVTVALFLGFDALISGIESIVLTFWHDWPTTVVQLINLAGVDSAINIVLSCWSAGALWRMGQGVNKVMVRGKPWAY
ncbi:MAG: DUF2523 domain-containing protein [Oceanospirillales bacterium]|nr:DUF2523 domain-containing protein [Oceanospirillales bacterium]